MSMYRVIIADDEPLIIRGLRKMMDWEKLGTEVIAEAQDGTELMELLWQHQPDIIISDISMPGLSGLDIIKEISEHNLETKVIFVSGFQEFGFAKAAIKYGAVDYLLKPVTVEELEKAIERAKEMLEMNQPEAMWNRERENVEADLRRIGNQKPKSVERVAKGKGSDFTGIRFVLSESDVGQIKNNSRFELMRFAVFRQIEEYLQEMGWEFQVRRDENASGILLTMSEGKTRQDVQETVQKVQQRLKERFGLMLIAGIGASAPAGGSEEYLQKTAKFAAGLYYFTRKELIDYQEIDRNFTHSFEEYEELCKDLTQKMLSRDEAWKQCLQNCLQMIRNLHYGSRYAVESRCTIMLMTLYKDLQEYKVIDGEYRGELEREIENLRTCSTFEELKRAVAQIAKHIWDHCEIQKSENEVITKVKVYIQEHFAEEITLDQVAQHVYMNPYYFSTFFKKETGQNFKTYLLEVRMKNALRYLMESDMKTYELARSVGYHDVRTFTDKFREFYGKSPAQYRKK